MFFKTTALKCILNFMVLWVHLGMGKSAGVDIIPEELVQSCAETMIDFLTEICNRI